MTRSVWETAEAESLKHDSQSHKRTREYSQLHDKVEVGFTFKDLFQRYNVGVFNPGGREKMRNKCKNIISIYKNADT